MPGGPEGAPAIAGRPERALAMAGTRMPEWITLPIQPATNMRETIVLIGSGMSSTWSYIVIAMMKTPTLTV
ncbi:hypothetical protein ACFSTC_54040 [Nonomuraea ferruginea]